MTSHRVLFESRRAQNVFLYLNHEWPDHYGGHLEGGQTVLVLRRIEDASGAGLPCDAMLMLPVIRVDAVASRAPCFQLESLAWCQERRAGG